MSTNNNRRIIVSTIAGLIVLIGAFALSRQFASMQAPPKRKMESSGSKEVEVLPIELDRIPTTLEVQGELTAFNKIDIFTEVSGTMVDTERPFKEGAYFPKGSVLIQVDQEESRLSILSQKANLLNAITQMMPDLKVDYPESFAQWNAYLENFDLESSIAPLPKPLNQQERYFIASRNIQAQYFTIKSAEERLSKFTIYAPFSGVITESSINQGALVRAGQKLGELMNAGSYELEATVPVRDLQSIKPGAQVKLYSDDVQGQWLGSVRRISNKVDPATQTVKVFIGTSGENLREGMYLKGDISAPPIDSAVAIPRELLVDQEYVFMVQDTVLRRRPVQVIKMTKQEAIVRGLKAGELLMKTRLPAAFDGMRVQPKNATDAVEAEPNSSTNQPVGTL